jgi:hypothetical protein
LEEQEKRLARAGRLIVEVQSLSVARLAADGKDAYLAEHTLQLFIRTLELLEHRGRQLRKEIEADKERSNKASARALGVREPRSDYSDTKANSALAKLERLRGRLLH